MENVLLIIGKDKSRHSTDSLLVSSDNVYFTSAGVFMLKDKIYGIDKSCTINYEDVVTAIMEGDDVVIGLQFEELVAVIIPAPLQVKLEKALEVEDYMLAHKIKILMDQNK